MMKSIPWMQKMTTINYKKWTLFLIGVATFTAGVPFLTHSNLGLSPYDSGLIGLMGATGLPVTFWSNAIAVLALFLAGIMDRKFPNVLTIISSFLTGLGIDFWLWLIEDRITLPALPSFVVGMLINAFGIAIYLSADALPTAVDNFMLHFCNHFKVKILWGRVLCDVFGFVISLCTGGPIGAGTVVGLFAMGPLIQLFIKLLSKFKLFTVKQL